jgi:hypothetical protein
MGLESPRGCYDRPRGGAAGIRTPDLRRARAALSRLSYGPARAGPSRVGAPGLEPGTSALSGPRSHHLSYAPADSRPGRLPFVHSGRSVRVAPGQHPPHAQDGARGRSRTSNSRCQGSSAQSNSRPFHQPTRSAADLPGIRGAPARSCHRLATGGSRGSVPTNAGSPLGSLTRSEASRRLHSLERR